jgi:hypothetical protein
VTANFPSSLSKGKGTVDNGEEVISIRHDERAGELEVEYRYEPPEPQLTVRQLREKLAEFPDDTPVQVLFGAEGPHERLVDDPQVVTDVEQRTLSYGNKPDGTADERIEPAVSILAHYAPGTYTRYIKRGGGNWEYDALLKQAGGGA